MILHCTFEELSALSAAAERVLSGSGEAGIAVAAPPEVVADLEALCPRLVGDITVRTLAEQRSLLRAIDYVLTDARARMDTAILEGNPAAEDAIAAYFEYANVLNVEDRLRHIGEEMTALIELMTGQLPTEDSSRSILFSDE